MVAKDTAVLWAFATEGAGGVMSVFLWEVKLSVISHCDSQAGHMDKSISRGRVPVRQLLRTQSHNDTCCNSKHPCIC